MEIGTERLLIAALTPEQLEEWTEDIGKLEKELDCVYRAEPLEGMFREIVTEQLRRAREDYRWYSFWFIIREPDRMVVGSASFKSKPDVKGEVEIGYGLGEEFGHNGYMTEAVRALCGWVMGQKGVVHVIAETEADGWASQGVLQRCGFTEYSRGDTVWWRL